MEEISLKCPKKGEKPCFCIESFIHGKEVDLPEILDQNKIHFLLKLHQDALSLKGLKYTDGLYKSKKNSKKTRGWGKKRSNEFICFVLKNRKILRAYGICEAGAKHLLLYSNNLIHRKLKHDVDARNDETIKVRCKGAVVLGKLLSLSEIAKIRCCKNYCTQIITKLPGVAASWRDRSLRANQKETRKVLLEMLLPSANNDRNCNKFVRLITGCSRTTISKVCSKMKFEYDDLNLKKHGLVDYKKQKKETTLNSPPITNTQVKSSSLTSKFQREITCKNSNESFITVNTDGTYCLSTSGSLVLPTTKGKVSIPVSIGIPLEVSSSIESSIPIKERLCDQAVSSNSNFLIPQSSNQPQLSQTVSLMPQYSATSLNSEFISIPNSNILCNTSHFPPQMTGNDHVIFCSAPLLPFTNSAQKDGFSQNITSSLALQNSQMIDSRNPNFHQILNYSNSSGPPFSIGYTQSAYVVPQSYFSINAPSSNNGNVVYSNCSFQSVMPYTQSNTTLGVPIISHNLLYSQNSVNNGILNFITSPNATNSYH